MHFRFRSFNLVIYDSLKSLRHGRDINDPNRRFFSFFKDHKIFKFNFSYNKEKKPKK